MHLAAEANSRVDPRDAAMMLEAGGSGSAGRGPTEPSHGWPIEAALRKKKPQVMGLLKAEMCILFPKEKTIIILCHV